MIEEGHQVASLHGAKEGAERDRIIDDFRDGKSKVLITTNVIARGIDILQVNMVVNYDMPLTSEGKPDPETYPDRRLGKFPRGHQEGNKQKVCGMAGQLVCGRR